MNETDHQPDGDWLNARERAAWLGVAALILKLPAALDSQLQQAVDLNLFEYLVLARLSEHPSRRMRMSDLATLANGSRSRLSHTAQRLSDRGYLERRPDPTDGRYTEAFLTDAGYAVVVRAAPAHVATVRHLVIDAVTPEQLPQLADIGQRVVARIEPGVSWPP
jgi:DNA-binding MarR family transcriptional regulator